MEPLSLVLAIPSIVTAIRKCVRQYTELQTRFQGVNDEIQWIASKCTLLESALQQLRQIDTRNHEHIVDFVTKDCLRTIHALNGLLGRLGACIAETGAVSFGVRMEYAWKQEDIAAVLGRLDDCRSNITLCMTILQFEVQRCFSPPGMPRHEEGPYARGRHDSVTQSDDSTLRFSIISRTSKFSTTAIYLNPDRDSDTRTEFDFDQHVQSSRAYTHLGGRLGRQVPATHAAKHSALESRPILREKDGAVDSSASRGPALADSVDVVARDPNNWNHHHGFSQLDEQDSPPDYPGDSRTLPGETDSVRSVKVLSAPPTDESSTELEDEDGANLRTSLEYGDYIVTSTGLIEVERVATPDLSSFRVSSKGTRILGVASVTEFQRNTSQRSGTSTTLSLLSRLSVRILSKQNMKPSRWLSSKRRKRVYSFSSRGSDLPSPLLCYQDLITPPRTPTSESIWRSSISFEEYQIVVLGIAGVGKGQLSFKFIRDHSDGEDGVSPERAHQKVHLIDGKPVRLDVQISADGDGFSAMQERFLRTGDGFLILYSVADRRSFVKARNLYLEIMKVKQSMMSRVSPAETAHTEDSKSGNSWNNNLAAVLVGNHCSIGQGREVDTKDGEELARCLGCKFAETDCERNLNVEAAFYELVREVRRVERLREWLANLEA